MERISSYDKALSNRGSTLESVNIDVLTSVNDDRDEEFNFGLKKEAQTERFSELEVTDIMDDDLEHRIWAQFVRPSSGSMSTS